jgi:hypothetical protein
MDFLKKSHKPNLFTSPAGLIRQQFEYVSKPTYNVF